MSKKNLKSLGYLLTIVIVWSILTACQKSEANLNGIISIYTDEYTVLEETALLFSEGQTVLDMLKEVTREHKIHMEYSGTGVASYVKGIDNIYEFDKGAESGWIYSVNGDVCNESAGAVKLTEGDKVVWQYVLTP